MFAKFSPDAKSVAYVHQNDIYLHDTTTDAITRLMQTGSPTKINGTFDWAYEEEFSLRDGFRFSPNGKRIAFWEINATQSYLYRVHFDGTDFQRITPESQMGSHR